MLNLKPIIVFIITSLTLVSASQACTWVKLDPRTLECYTPYREFLRRDSKIRGPILQVSLKAAETRLHQILNESDVMALLVDNESLYKAGNTEAVDKMIARSSALLGLANDISIRGENYVMSHSYWDSFNGFNTLPSAILIGFTAPFKRGLDLSKFGKVFGSMFKFIPRLRRNSTNPASATGDGQADKAPAFEVGGGSIFVALVIVPQIVEYIAKHDPSGEFIEMNNEAEYQMVYEDEDNKMRIYAVTGSSDVWRFAKNLQNGSGLHAYPTADIRFSKDAGKATKTTGLQPTLGFAWGDSIHTDEDVGAWGISYSLPTSLARVSSEAFRQATFLGAKWLGTHHLTLGLLRGADKASIDTLKVSFNSNDDFMTDASELESGLNLKTFPFDQVIATVRWSDIGKRRTQGTQPTTPGELMQARFGFNFDFGTTFGSALRLFDTPVLELISDAAGDTLSADPGANRGQGRSDVNTQVQARMDAVNSAQFQNALTAAIGSAVDATGGTPQGTVAGDIAAEAIRIFQSNGAQ